MLLYTDSSCHAYFMQLRDCIVPDVVEHGQLRLFLKENGCCHFWYMLSHTIEWVSQQNLRIGMRYREIYLWLALVIVVINAAVKNIALVAYHIDLLKLLDGIS